VSRSRGESLPVRVSGMRRGAAPGALPRTCVDPSTCSSCLTDPARLDASHLCGSPPGPEPKPRAQVTEASVGEDAVQGKQLANRRARCRYPTCGDTLRNTRGQSAVAPSPSVAYGRRGRRAVLPHYTKEDTMQETATHTCSTCGQGMPAPLVISIPPRACVEPTRVTRTSRPSAASRTSSCTMTGLEHLG
jgi:hypothetical protein